MPKDKRSFFERLTGSIRIDDFEDVDSYNNSLETENYLEETSDEEYDDSMGELAIDMFEKPDAIVIKAIVAGVKPEDLDISITREMVTITGKRDASHEEESDNVYHKELYWGSFSRTILLPQEVEIEEAEANEKHGLLVITLPKINKDKSTKLKVRPGN